MSELVSTNPADNYAVVGQVTISDETDIYTKVAAANQAKTAWKALGVEPRIALLEPIRDEFQKRTGEIAELISRETGKPIVESVSEAEDYVEEITWFLENGPKALANEITHEDDESLHEVVYEPYGVAAAIAPWNFPFGMAVWGVFPNLVAGNTVVFKTSEECPLVGQLFEEVMSSHGLPQGVFSEVYGAGDVGKTLVESDGINLLWFTGSTRTGKELYKTAAEKFIKAVMEMGGSNPAIVFEDVDPVKAAPVIFDGRFQHCGQVCDSTKRLVVHESIAGSLVRELKALIEVQRIGSPLDKSTQIGSLVAKRQLDLVQAQLQDVLDKGAEVVARAKLPHDLKGAFLAPTLLQNITKDMRIWQEEVFGPVLPLVTFKTEAEAIELANDTPYGLGSRVMSSDKERAERVASSIEAGTVEVNYGSRWLTCNPFGGYKNSGIGRELGIHGLRELSRIKLVSSSK
ncbi:MAG TPA: aldehyde dehydrogenase family protein [Verrucomicrobiae bacterium]|jgi:acyl-CoA reductase-like NAD-dependent aldehyde dehydrogenase|nr:aldehyde dehydrogenase family protein [Verrucomicrobiae bacterium]